MTSETSKNAQPLATKYHLLAILLLTVLVHLPSLGGSFVWDDRVMIEQAEPSTLALARIPEYFTSPIASYFRPLPATMVALDYNLWGLRPFGFLLTNLLVHLLTITGLFFTVKQLRDHQQAVMAALIYALMPVHVENLAWIAGRHDSLGTMPFIWAFLCYVLGRQAKGLSKQSGYFGLSLLLYATALAGKEMAATLPAVCVVWECERVGRGAESKKPAALVIALMFGLLALYLVLRGRVVSRPIRPESGTALLQNLATFIAVIPSYLWWCLCPWPSSVYRDTAMVTSLTDPRLFLALVFIAGLLFEAFRRDRLRLPILAFLGTLVPISGLVPLGHPPDIEYLAAERWLYLPSLFVAMGAARLLVLIKPPKVFWAVSLAVLVAWLPLSIHRQLQWRRPATLWTAEEQHSPRSWVVPGHLGRALYHEKNFEGAAAAYERAEAKARARGRANEQAIYNRAVALIGARRYAEARGELLRYLSTEQPERREAARALLRRLKDL